MSQQQQWATALKKAQQQASRTQKETIDQQLEHVFDSIRYQKDLLQNFLKNGNKKRTEKTIEKLFALRAKQAALLIKEKKDDGILTNYLVQKYTRAYARDCVKLLAFVKMEEKSS